MSPSRHTPNFFYEKSTGRVYDLSSCVLCNVRAALLIRDLAGNLFYQRCDSLARLFNLVGLCDAMYKSFEHALLPRVLRLWLSW